MLVRRQLSSCPYAAHLIKSFLHDALQGSKKWNVYKAGKMICAHEELGYLTVRLGKGRGNKKKVTKASSLRLSHLGFAHKDKRHILMYDIRASLVAQMVKNMPAVQEIQV